MAKKKLPKIDPLKRYKQVSVIAGCVFLAIMLYFVYKDNWVWYVFFGVQAAFMFLGRMTMSD